MKWVILLPLMIHGLLSSGCAAAPPQYYVAGPAPRDYAAGIYDYRTYGDGAMTPNSHIQERAYYGPGVLGGLSFQFHFHGLGDGHRHFLFPNASFHKHHKDSFLQRPYKDHFFFRFPGQHRSYSPPGSAGTFRGNIGLISFADPVSKPFLAYSIL